MAEKILVVDDEIALQETLTYNLKKEGYLVEVAGDGIAALELFRTSKPDLVILDVMLPGMMKLTVWLGWKSARMITCPNRSACAS